MLAKTYYVYILASGRNGTLYTGVTNDVIRRSTEHKQKSVQGFTKRYGVHRLVWFEANGSIHHAIAREKQIKHWNRQWRINLFRDTNPNWDDLHPALVGPTI
jgi:putative endonuclease